MIEPEVALPSFEDLFVAAASRRKYIGSKEIKELSRLFEVDPDDVKTYYVYKLSAGRKMPLMLINSSNLQEMNDVDPGKNIRGFI